MEKIEYKSDLQKLYPANSESIEPAFAHMLGVMGMRYFKAKESGNRDLMIEAAIDLWGILELINLQTIFLGNATHASIAIMNYMQQMDKMIEADLGISCILSTDKRFKVIEMCSENWDNWYNEAKTA